MARPREFAIDVVLGQAMELFWRRGYAATAMSDIYAATGLRPASLYGAFKDKEELFRRAFERYAEHFRATLPADREGIAAIEAWLHVQARLASDDPERRGCLIVNTITEREIHSAATRALAQGRLQEIRDFFVTHLSVARGRGELPAGLAIQAGADALLGAVVAIMTLGRAGADTRTIANVADSALRALVPDR